jgi:hypothetical protein
VRSRVVDLNVVFRSNYGTVQGLAAVGGVAALAPLLTMNIQSPDTNILGPIVELPPRVIGLAWHRDRFRPPSLEAFVHTARVCASNWRMTRMRHCVDTDTAVGADPRAREAPRRRHASHCHIRAPREHTSRGLQNGCK